MREQGRSSIMRILITGANGQLGSELQAVLAAGHTDLGILPKAYNEAALLATAKSDLDITRQADVNACIQKTKPDLIINCAAFNDVDACEGEPEKAKLINATAAGYLAKAAKTHGAKLLHLSTDYVFSGKDETPRTENNRAYPINVYGASKLAGEQEIKTRCDRYFIVRTAWLYGHTGTNFVKAILKLARTNGSIQVVNDQFGNPTNVNDLAHMLLKLALSEEYGTYHCSGTGVCSRFEFASAIVDIAKIPCKKQSCTTTEFPRPALRPHFSALDNTRMSATLGEKMRPWHEALAAHLAKQML